MRMPVLALLAAGSAVPVSAQTYVWDMFITPENGGLQSRVSWNFTGTLSWTVANLSFPIELNVALVFGGDADGLKPYNVRPVLNEYNGDSTGIIITNSRTLQSATVDGIFFPGNAEDFFKLSIGSGPGFGGALPIDNGDVLTWNVPATGSFVIDLEYSTFNEGFWTRAGDTTGSFNNLTIGTPVPEPSTYGLLLGGLALAGAALRRRQRAK